MDTLGNLIKSQEFDIMKNLLFVKSALASGENNEELIKKTSACLATVKDKYTKLKILAESSSDLKQQLLNRKIEAYKQKCEEIQNDLNQIRFSSKPTNENSLENAQKSGLRSEQIAIHTLGKLQSQTSTVDKFASWSIEKEIKDSNSTLIDLYVKKSKIKVSLVIIIILQVLIFLLVLKIKLS